MKIVYYLASLSIFNKWLLEGIITKKDFERLEDLMANKYGLINSIYRQKP